MDNIQKKVTDMAFASNTLLESIQDLKVSALPSISTAITEGSSSLTTFQNEVVQRLDAQEQGLEALKEKVTKLTNSMATLAAAAPPSTFTINDRALPESLVASAIANAAMQTNMASLLQRLTMNAIFRQKASAEGERPQASHLQTSDHSTYFPSTYFPATNDDDEIVIEDDLFETEK